MTALPLLKESLTVTHLRKLHRQGASQQAMARVAGSIEHFRYLDKRYGITRPPETDETAPLEGMTAAEALGTRHFRKWLRPPRFVPPELYLLVDRVTEVFEIEPGLLVSKRSYSFLMAPRSAFAGIAKQLWPHLDYWTLAHVLDRDGSMMATYLRNHDQFYASPDYTLKVERIIEAMGAAAPAPAQKEVA